jgi:hypothetical protein
VKLSRRPNLVVAIAIALAVLTGCADPPPSSPSTSAEPSTAAVRDDTFGLTLATDRSAYGPNDPITVSAAYTYLGPKATETAFHAAEAVGFRIAEVGGTREMGGAMADPCRSTGVVRGQAVAASFGKAGVVADDPNTGFDVAWYRDPVLTLPAGHWRIIAALDVSLGDCGGERHQLEASVDITVED